MIKSIPLLILCFGWSCFCLAQSNDELSAEKQEQLSFILDLVKNDQIKELAEHVVFPLKRANPLPDISTKESFILYYPILFDADFRKMLNTTKFNKENTIDTYVGLGLFNGELWLNLSGQIIAINYSSSQELVLKDKLKLETENQIHQSVAPWKENVLVCQNNKFLIRIDLMDDNTLRYVSWNKPKSIQDKPDLVLFNGEEEFMGTMGGVIYSFKNAAWTYEIEEVTMAESDEDLGFFLIVSLSGEEKLKVKLEERK